MLTDIGGDTIALYSGAITDFEIREPGDIEIREPCLSDCLLYYLEFIYPTKPRRKN